MLPKLCINKARQEIMIQGISGPDYLLSTDPPVDVKEQNLHVLYLRKRGPQAPLNEGIAAEERVDRGWAGALRQHTPVQPPLLDTHLNPVPPGIDRNHDGFQGRATISPPICADRPDQNPQGTAHLPVMTAICVLLIFSNYRGNRWQSLSEVCGLSLGSSPESEVRMHTLTMAQNCCTQSLIIFVKFNL